MERKKHTVIFKTKSFYSLFIIPDYTEMTLYHFLFNFQLCYFFCQANGGAHDVVSQASKHIQDYKNDVQRINECLEIAKQQQVDSLLEKKRARQQLKEAEIEEKKQSDALSSAKISCEKENRGYVSGRVDRDDKGIDEDLGKDERDEVEDKPGIDVKKEISENDRFNVSSWFRTLGTHRLPSILLWCL